MPKVDHAFAVQLRVGLEHGVRADDEFLRQGTNRRHLICGTPQAAFNRVLDLLHQLPVDRNAARRVQSEESGRQLFPSYGTLLLLKSSGGGLAARASAAKRPDYCVRSARMGSTMAARLDGR